MVNGLIRVYLLKRTEWKLGSGIRWVFSLVVPGWVRLIVRQKLRESAQLFPPPPNLKMISQQPPHHEGRKPQGGPVHIRPSAGRMASQGLPSSYITCNFQFWSSLCSSEWAITKAGFPASFSDINTFLWWGSRKVRAPGGLLGTTHHTQSPSLQVPFVKGLISLSSHFPSPNHTRVSGCHGLSSDCRWPPKFLDHSWLNELDN